MITDKEINNAQATKEKLKTGKITQIVGVVVDIEFGTDNCRLFITRSNCSMATPN